MKKALVIVSFGTTYERARRSIDAVERALAQAAEGYDVFRAYTSSIVRKVLKSRGKIVPSLEEALEKLANESYDTVFVQPTHLLCGNEYDEKIRASYMLSLIHIEMCIRDSLKTARSETGGSEQGLGRRPKKEFL